jgi:hypothetical protein
VIAKQTSVQTMRPQRTSINGLAARRAATIGLRLLPVMPPEFWVAGPRRRLVGADQKRSSRLRRRDRLKPGAALRRGKA